VPTLARHLGEPEATVLDILGGAAMIFAGARRS